jgi:hypothetical protein
MADPTLINLEKGQKGQKTSNTAILVSTLHRIKILRLRGVGSISVPIEWYTLYGLAMQICRHDPGTPPFSQRKIGGGYQRFFAHFGVNPA